MTRAKISGALLTMLAISLSAHGQTGADSFQKLEDRQLLREGDTIVITYTEEGRDEHSVARGTFVRFTDSAIEMQLDSGEDMELAASDVRRIEREHKDTVWKGAFIGAGVGLGLLALSCSDGFGCDSRAVAGGLVGFGGLGFAVGAGIDAAIGKNRVELVYFEAQPDTGSMTLSISPIIARAQKGVLVKVTW